MEEDTDRDVSDGLFNGDEAIAMRNSCCLSLVVSLLFCMSLVLIGLFPLFFSDIVTSRRRSSVCEDDSNGGSIFLVAFLLFGGWVGLCSLDGINGDVASLLIVAATSENDRSLF